MAEICEFDISGKALALAAGLGTIGRNGLLIAKKTNNSDIFDALDFQEHLIASDSSKPTTNPPTWSSAVLIGLMLLPFDFDMLKLEKKDIFGGVAPSFLPSVAIAGFVSNPAQAEP